MWQLTRLPAVRAPKRPMIALVATAAGRSDAIDLSKPQRLNLHASNLNHCEWCLSLRCSMKLE